MQKKLIIFTILTLLILTMVACNSDDTPESNIVSDELIKLLPTEGFKWTYLGSDDYHHEMVLESITGDTAQKIYRINGEVAVTSNDDKSKDHTIEVYYEVNSDSIVQKISSETSLDNEFNTLTLIKLPLEEGTKWTETVKDLSGKKVTVDCEIYLAQETDNGMKYEVSYRNKKDDYTETRQFIESLGVVSFTKKIMIGDDKITFGYGLHGKESGYNKVEDIASETTEDSTNDEDQVDNTETTEDSTTDSDTTDNTTDNASDSATETDDKAAEEAAVKKAIEQFNDAWIELVNNNNQEFFNHVTTNGVAYKNAKNFDSTGLTERFLVMNVNSVTVTGSTATAKVREEIEKTKDGEVTIAKYNWIYDLVKKDGKWLINGYKKQ